MCLAPVSSHLDFMHIYYFFYMIYMGPQVQFFACTESNNNTQIEGCLMGKPCLEVM